MFRKKKSAKNKSFIGDQICDVCREEEAPSFDYKHPLYGSGDCREEVVRSYCEFPWLGREDAFSCFRDY